MLGFDHPPAPEVPPPVRDGDTGQTLVDSARVHLQPVAAPSILGLFACPAATFMVSTNIAGWYGRHAACSSCSRSPPCSAGIARFAAGMWSYRARDAVATAVHGMWGSFWIAHAILDDAGRARRRCGAAGCRVPRGRLTWLHVDGWLLFASAVCAFYTGSAMTWNASFGRIVLPSGERGAGRNVPGNHAAQPIELHDGEPGVRQGQ